METFGPAETMKQDGVRRRDVVLLGASIAFLLFAMGISAVSLRGLKQSSDALDNHSRVAESSQLEYYLTVKSDGVDKNGKQSSDSTTANINGGQITVTDKIPDGLEFVGFKTTETGTIGAVSRSDSTVACAGRVIDDTEEESLDTGTWNAGHTEYTYHGLHYDASTRTVSFRAENIQAGCDLTVGIITQTPTLGDAQRKDFYNTASLNDNLLSLNSNTMHVWMGRDIATLYNVTYSYTGDVPDNAPSAPESQSYAEGATVGVASSPQVEGYQFSGWTTGDAVVSAGSFTMPDGNVAFTGSFSARPQATKYKVTYEIEGETPADFVAPKEREYEAGANVTLDGTTKGFMVDDYAFDGWTSEDVDLSETGFVMPAEDVTITGSFTRQTYEVKYRFEGEVRPANADALLPETKKYPAGTKVSLADEPEAEGYRFTGWYQNDNFTMPAEDIVIYGEWAVVAGTFKPEISIELVDAKELYGAGDTVEFKIRVMNTADFAIKDVQVLENTAGAVFAVGDGYEVKSEEFALIDEIPAGESVTLRSVYEVPEGSDGLLTNEVMLAGAIAEGNYTLDTDEEYLARVDFRTGEKADEEAPAGDDEEEAKDADATNTLDSVARYVAIGTLAVLGVGASLAVILKNGKK